jgi:NDP-sugar pyrophosphorylase family protein
VNYLADAIVQHFGDGSRLGVRIEYLRESAPMGTAGALAQLHERPSLPFLLVNGDVLTKLNFRSLLDFHNTHGAPMTVCVREYSYSIPYGVVMVRGDVLEQLEEKPSRQALVNAGIYVCDPEVLDFVERGNPTNATDIIAALVARQKYPQAFPIHEYWLDIGHHQDFSRAAAEFPTIFAGDAA